MEANASPVRDTLYSPRQTLFLPIYVAPGTNLFDRSLQERFSQGTISQSSSKNAITKPKNKPCTAISH